VRELKIPNKLVEELIEEDNPFPTVFSYLIEEIWTSKEKLSDYFEQEEKAKEFEKFLQDSYFELFTKELPKHTSEKLNVDFDDQKLVVLDMLSIREAVLLKKHLEDECYKVKLDYSFSAIPSTTQAFKKRIDLPEKKKKYKFKKINNFQEFPLDGDEEFIWSSFPDKWLESIQEGKKVLNNQENVYKDTEKHLDEILNQIEGDELVITSDHGYNVAKGAYQFPLAHSDQKRIKDIMGNNRSIRDIEVDADKLVSAGFLIRYNGYLMAQSRNIWPIGGSYSVYQHGGASLMECITPKLKVKRGNK